MAQPNINKLCGTNLATTYFYVFNNYFLFPAFERDNIDDSLIVFCSGAKKYYYLEGIELSENTFLNLKFKQLEIIKENSGYNYLFQNNDTTNCISSVRFFISTTVPIYLNGVKLNESDKTTKLKELIREEKIKVQIRRPLFSRKRYIMISSYDL